MGILLECKFSRHGHRRAQYMFDVQLGIVLICCSIHCYLYLDHFGRHHGQILYHNQHTK